MSIPSAIKRKGSVYLIVIDGWGAGAQQDASDYGDEQANTLAHVCAETNCRLPNFQNMGLGNIIPLASVPPEGSSRSSWGKMQAVSSGKDSTTGHWELAGIILERPFPTYPDGFPNGIIEAFCKGIGRKNVLCNMPYSGTDVIRDFGDEHLDSGLPIIYTSADSVFQVACHEDVAPVSQLYEWCRFARNHVMTGENAVGRVIARPFGGKRGNFKRITNQRHDFSLKPPTPNLLQHLQENGVKTYSIGKVADLFSEDLFTQYRRTKNNAEGIAQLLSLMSAKMDGFVFVNLIDTDQLYGHRQDVVGYAECLQEIDRAIPAILKKLCEDDLLIITSDHGNDPADDSTDHTREYVPLLVADGKRIPGYDLGTRQTFSDVASTVSRYFGLSSPFPGTSFLRGSLKNDSNS